MASPEKAASGAGDGDASPGTMERFRRLAKGLLAVPLPELKDAERLYQIEREALAENRKPKPGPLKAKPAA